MTKSFNDNPNPYSDASSWPYASTNPEDDVPDIAGHRFSLPVLELMRYADEYAGDAIRDAIHTAPIHLGIKPTHPEAHRTALDRYPELVCAMIEAQVAMRIAFLDAALRCEVPITVSGDWSPGAPEWVLRRHD